MKKPLKIVAILVALCVGLFAVLALVVGSIDADKYRPQLIQAITKQTGREAKLDGPIAFSLGLAALHVSIQNASIANTSWGSRPVMAGMGKFDLSLGLLPLLSHHVVVDKLSIENADILLETDASGHHNWEFGNAATPAPLSAPAAAPQPVPGSSPVESISVKDLHITNSQLAMRDATGKVSSVNVADLDLDMSGSGAVLTFTGDADGVPLTLDVKTSIADLLSKEPFTFDATVAYDPFKLHAQGTADLAASKADISAYEVTAGKTTINGDVSALWSGPRPVIHGTLSSDSIDPADFKSAGGAETADTAPGAKGTEASPGSKRVFSEAPLPFGGLRAADADLAVSVAALQLGQGSLKKISAKLTLANGNLSLSPVKANIGAVPVDVQFSLDASQSPARLGVKITGNGVDLGDLQKLGGMTPFMEASASANIQLAGQGNSLHEIASSLVGVITITAEKGTIMTGAAAKISSTLSALFSGGGSNDALNCVAARFIAKNGVLNDNGILIDSAASVVSGKGNVNLDSETVALTLHAKTKLVDVGGLVPALQITGGLTSPHYSVDAAGMVKNVVGSLVNGNIDVIASDVPDMQVAPAGQNNCVYTLDHPKAATSSGILSTNPVSKVQDKVKNLGGSMLKGLLGQ